MEKLRYLMHSATGAVTTEQNWRKGYEDLVEAFKDPELMCMLWYGCGLHVKAHEHSDADWASMLIEVKQGEDGKWIPVFANKST